MTSGPKPITETSNGSFLVEPGKNVDDLRTNYRQL